MSKVEGPCPHMVPAIADSLRLSPVTLLELFPGTARARIVAAHLFLPAHHLLHRLRVSGPSHARLFQLATLAPHKSFFQIVG